MAKLYSGNYNRHSKFEMTQQKVQFKTYVRGSFLQSTDGFDFQEKHREAGQKVFEDKTGMLSIPKQIRQKKQPQVSRRKVNNNVVQKPVLIAIRDTPVEPVPEPVLDNQRCERATQQQFQYFQTYISQKEKQRHFQEQEEQQIKSFMQSQEKLKQQQQETPHIALVMERQENKPQTKLKNHKTFIKIKIKRKNQNLQVDPKEQQEHTQTLKKVRVLNFE